MTRKHYRALADAIATIDNPDHREEMAHLIGEVCRADNCRFDWYRWNCACRTTSAALAMDRIIPA